MTKCIVFGCPNHKYEGQFVGDICAPCHNMITTGKIGSYCNFIGKIYLDFKELEEKKQYEKRIFVRSINELLSKYMEGDL